MEMVSISKEELEKIYKRITVLEMRCNNINGSSLRCESCDTRMELDEIHKEIDRDPKWGYSLMCNNCRGD